MRAHSLLVVLLLLSACGQVGGNLAQLRAKKPSAGGNFNEALAAEYLAYAESLGEEGHPIRSNHFADKGLRALGGENVPLEDKPALANRKPAVEALLNPDIKSIAPDKAARLQLLYDCWAEKEGVCEQSFMEAFTDLQLINDKLSSGGENFSVSFAPGSAALSPKTNKTLDKIVRELSHYAKPAVVIKAIGDPKDKNGLAWQRSKALEVALKGRGAKATIWPSVAKSDASLTVELSTDAPTVDPDKVTISVATEMPGRTP